MSQIQVQQHPASVDAYIRHGWALVPIPPGTKGPRTTNWNRPENVLKSQTELPVGWGIGLAHAYSGTMAIDVDNWERAHAELLKNNIDLNVLYQAPDAVIVHSNRPGHGKLLYKMPEGLVLPSKKLIDTSPDGQKYNYLDFRCGTSNGLTVQDVLPPSIHPDTKQPYQWHGYGHWSRLPEIPATLLSYWQNLVNADNTRTITSGEGVNASWAEIQSAIDTISPDISRDEWVQVGMALHWAGTQTNQTDQALSIWNEWSLSSPTKYKGPNDVMTQWNSFRIDKNNSVKLGTLFRLAKNAGWVRPEPDVTELFKSVTNVTRPEMVLLSLRPPAPDMDMDNWPTIIKDRSLEVAESIGCDPLVPLWSGIAAICGVVDSRIRLELLPGFKVPPILWMMTLGDPADKKSPGSRPMLSPLKSLELEDHPRFKRDMLEWEGREAMYASSKKAFLEFAASPEGMLNGDQAPLVADLPPQPVPVKITVSDITSQKLVRHCADRPRGVLCHLDEMNAWIRKLTDKSSGEDRSAWVVSYEGEAYEMDRVGAGSIHADNLAVSIYGNIQPRVYRENVQQLSADGLLQRFLPAILRPHKTKLGNPIPEYLTKSGAWENTLRLVYSLPPMTYRLSSEAYKTFREFQGWYETTKHEERMLQAPDEYMTAFGKLEGTTGRLLLVCHLMENPFSIEVSNELLKRVISIVKGYVIPALRYSLGELGTVDSFESWLMDYLIQYSDKPTISLADIKASARRQIEKMTPAAQNNLVILTMTTFEKYQWVVRMDDKSREFYGSAQWAINPALGANYKDYRETVVKLKQKRLDELYTKGVRLAHGFTGSLSKESVS
jgi:hypothetical protein